ncbi:MAG: sodium:calcium antiporter, partial [Deltaproteobacteria bacterium]|nr:sodium:calcium antiporter [Kofleriaceae bacterium]
MTYVLAFVLGGAIVCVAGTALARHVDAIAEATGISRAWIGAVLLAGATSLPELTTDVAAVRMGATDLAVGDLFGSSMANMLILAAIDLMPPRRGLLQHVTLDHALAACLAIALNTMATLFVLLRPDSSVAWVGPASLALFLGYLAGSRAVYRHAARASREPSPAAARDGVRAPPSL